jgi:hypothetical protein
MTNISKKTIHHLFLIDESGSMQRLSEAIISNVHEMLDAVRALAQKSTEINHVVTLLTFNGIRIKTHLRGIPSFQLPEFDEIDYHPQGASTIYDCLGLGIALVRSNVRSNRSKTRVSVTLVSDGFDTGSQKYCSATLRNMISALKRQGWLFNYVGIEDERQVICHRLGITNSFTYRLDYNQRARNKARDLLVRKKMREVYTEMGSKGSIAAA